MTVNPDDIKETIIRNTAEIVRLHRRMDQALDALDGSEKRSEEWTTAWKELRARFEILSFPGGYAGALDRISAGDLYTVEAAICFLELRPYFFRSGYMFKDILRKCRRAPLSETQSARLASVIKKRNDWQAAHPKSFSDSYIKRSLANRARFSK